MTVDPKIAAALQGVSTGTITTVLLKKGLRNVWMRGTRPIRTGQPRLLERRKMAPFAHSVQRWMV